MLLKKGVSLLGVKPEMIIGLMVADQCYKDAGFTLVVTSLVDGKHSKTSRHYLGLAGDLRTHNIHNPEAMVLKLKEQLPEFVIIFENKGKPQEHIHMQFNGKPK